VNNIKKLLNELPHHMKVEFAVYCVNDIKSLIPKEALPALELTEKWLRAPHLVFKKELNAAAYAAAYAADAADAAADAADAAADAADAAADAAAYAADAAADAADAADAAADAADAAAYATYAASYTTKKEEKLAQYEAHLMKMIDNLTELEKIIYTL